MVDYDENTALVVVDVQNDFADPSGSLYVRGGEDVVPIINGEVERAVAAGALIVYTMDWHPLSTRHFDVWPAHCVQETPGAALHPGLRVEGEVLKTGVGGEDGYSGFTVRDPTSGVEQDTWLERRLRQRGITKVVIAGLATDYCVKETALDSAKRGFETILLSDAVRAVDVQPGDGERAVAAMRAAGVRVE